LVISTTSFNTIPDAQAETIAAPDERHRHAANADAAGGRAVGSECRGRDRFAGHARVDARRDLDRRACGADDERTELRWRRWCVKDDVVGCVAPDGVASWGQPMESDERRPPVVAADLDLAIRAKLFDLSLVRRRLDEDGGEQKRKNVTHVHILERL
jgi:hypothetical protein